MMVKNCGNCANYCGHFTGKCGSCFSGTTLSNWEPGKNYAPPTHAEHVRSMTDEALAQAD